MTEIKRLGTEHREELSRVLNYSFKGDPSAKHFETILPKMWLDDERFLPRHFAAFEDGKAVAVLGVYTYPVVIGDKNLLFATVGNIGTTPEARGKGYMQKLISVAMQELETLGVDVSRLSGLRTRYERFGYEPCGTVYRVNLTKRNASDRLKQGGAVYTFEKLLKDDTADLDFVRKIYEKDDIHVLRGNDEYLYATLNSWNCYTRIAFKNGQKIGYITASEDGNYIPEYGGITPCDTVDMLCAFVGEVASDTQCEIPVLPNNTELAQIMIKICESFKIDFPTQFKVLNWDKTVAALIDLKRRRTVLDCGEAVIEIKDWGLLKITVGENFSSAEKVENAVADISLDKLTAARFLFGPAPYFESANVKTDKARLFNSWFPLPFTWHALDSL